MQRKLNDLAKLLEISLYQKVNHKGIKTYRIPLYQIWAYFIMNSEFLL